MENEKLIELASQQEARITQLEAIVLDLQMRLASSESDEPIFENFVGDDHGLVPTTDEQLSCQAGDLTGYLGTTNALGVVRSSDGSITMTRTDPGGGVAPYKDLTVNINDDGNGIDQYFWNTGEDVNATPTCYADEIWDESATYKAIYLGSAGTREITIGADAETANSGFFHLKVFGEIRWDVDTDVTGNTDYVSTGTIGETAASAASLFDGTMKDDADANDPTANVKLGEFASSSVYGARFDVDTGADTYTRSLDLVHMGASSTTIVQANLGIGASDSLEARLCDGTNSYAGYFTGTFDGGTDVVDFRICIDTYTSCAALANGDIRIINGDLRLESGASIFLGSNEYKRQQLDYHDHAGADQSVYLLIEQ